jgi:molybdopterin-guanine dinucleotide biosynthesis protein A
MSSIGGIVLCGGRSTRMGQPKEWLTVGQTTMLQQVVSVISNAISGPVVVVAAPGQVLPALSPHLRIVRDQIQGLGPLMGFATGLEWLAMHVDRVFLAACDMPFLTPRLIHAVCDAIDNFDACVPVCDERTHPLSACYRSSVLDRVQQQVNSRHLKFHAFLDTISVRYLDLHSCNVSLSDLQNINTPLDYARFQDMLTHSRLM